ncbi:hypothetical protein A2866_00030 [Candidatus Roizmanbacteria bacterium RIFCSPHIGHO2_01_FULL_39_8]|uniref:Glycosyltransferase RgtA/B/C/D-like domain-containing protein n=2 Tax=Candidatus Roizmaniibacteriota TaxID=1752723 RepID=A0A1F7GQ72_9BACT|nr:MAG: hypothetical protein A2866_00030 [Candidatus Roizmanbacteria bacterium RIFCSPHIGHO2_01_FULL_39_8]
MTNRTKLLSKKNVLLFILLSISAFLNIYGFGWDGGHYLHPDERLYVNASNIQLPKNLGEFLSPSSPLNPHMFYYGPLPLYLYKLTSILTPFINNFLFSGRILSALIMVCAALVIFHTAKLLFDEKIGFIALFIFIFSPGIIQHAHFITTEAILTFFLSLIVYICCLIIKKNRFKLFPLVGLILGLAAASKITAASFFMIPLTTFVFLLITTGKKLRLTLYFIFLLVIFIFSSTILAPYQIIDFSRFNEEQRYMQSVVLGLNKPPFVIIYEGTIPYLYQLFRIFPLTFGFVSLPLAVLGFLMLARKLYRPPRSFLLIVLLIFPLAYFAWSGAWFNKFSRYYILLIPFLSLFAAYSLMKFKKNVKIFFLFLIATNGIVYFTNLYLKPNTRVAASSWIYGRVSEKSTIAGEHWDDSLPLPILDEGKDQYYLPEQYNLVSLQVYDQPDDEKKIDLLASQLSQSDYFIISSRRVFYSILRNSKSYPYTSLMYKKLFSGQLGFRLEKQFTNYPFFISDDWADESFQSYDHPPVYIFKNEARFPAEKISFLIKS